MFQARPIAWTARLCAFSGFLTLSGQAHAAIHALLIGITDYDYQESKVSDLQGPVNDIQLMRDVLTDRFKVPARNIAMLKNGTHTQIEKAFADLTARVQKNDQVYIHYSGHGSWYKSPNPEERRGQDETWVTHGSRSPTRQGKDAVDVLDKELGTWLLKLHAITPDVVLVSDSCHSASMTRDVQVGARSADGVLQAHPLRKDFPDKIVYPEDAGLRIGAAREFESAVELDPELNTRCFDSKRCYGVFTWNWAQALQASRPGESWGDVYDRALAAIEAKSNVMQRPQKEGNARRAVFGGTAAPLTPTVPVQTVRADGQVVLGAGRLSGLTVGTELAGVVATNAKAPRLKITSVSASTAQAKVLEGQIKAGGLLKVSKYHDVEPRITLYVGGPQAGGVDAALAAQVKKAIEQARSVMLQNFDLVDHPEAAQWRLEIVRPKDADTAKLASLPAHVTCTAQPCAGTELWVVNPFGVLMHEKMRLPMSNPEADLPRLLLNLDTFSRAQEVRGIARQGNTTPLEARVTVLRPPTGSKETCSEGANGAAGWRKVVTKPFSKLATDDIQFNDCLAFTVENKGATSWYGYVLNVDPNLKINRVWPTPSMSSDAARIEPASTYAVNNTFYRLDLGGRETLLFIASEQPTSMAALSEGGMRGGSDSPLARLSRMGTLTRGVEAAAEEGLWGAQSVALDVKPKP